MDENKKLAVAALVIMFGSNAGSLVNSVNPKVRSDPFTGTEGDALQSRIYDLEIWKTQHILWGRDASVIHKGNYERHEAQIQELYRHIGHK